MNRRHPEADQSEAGRTSARRSSVLPELLGHTALGQAAQVVARLGHPDPTAEVEDLVVGRSAATWFAQTCYGYSGVSLFAKKVV